jgi:signal transduction histidine kinase
MRTTTRVLVVEDSDTQALALRKALETAGFEVEVARDGPSGLAAFAASRFDLVLSDVIMPGFSGYDLCHQIKTGTRASNRDTPVILLTALREPCDIIRGLECGADDFISKPFDAFRLMVRIEALLGSPEECPDLSLETGIDIGFMGERFTISSPRRQILTFLASTFEDFVRAQQREHACRIAQERHRLEAEAARDRAEILRREKEGLDRMLHDLLAAQQELRRVNDELDRRVEELSQANSALTEMNRLRGNFLATVSHELRTPLNSVLGFSEVLSGSERLSEPDRRYLANIQTSGKMLLVMINEILDSARLEGGRMKVRTEEFSLRDLCDSLVRSMRPVAERKGLKLECLLDGETLAVRQDPGKLRQIISNLLCNAIKFTPGGGQVVLGASVERAELIVSVADTGIGIAPADSEKIFERFYQVLEPDQRDGVLVREHQGTGLGLSIARDLSRLLGGDITLESQPGRGSTFTVRLPQQRSSFPSATLRPTEHPCRTDRP